MFDSLITSKTRLRLLMKFFINQHTSAYLRNLANEFNESTNSIRQELNRFEEADLLKSETIQNKKIYKANTRHPFFDDIHRLLLKYIGIDQIVDEVVSRVGNLIKAYVTGDFAKGNPGNIIDIVLIGNNFDNEYINKLVRKAEENVSFKIRYITIEPEQESNFIKSDETALLVWQTGM
jgi:hypothetical protein